MVPAYPAKAKCDENNQNMQILTGPVIQWNGNDCLNTSLTQHISQYWH